MTMPPTSDAPKRWATDTGARTVEVVRRLFEAFTRRDVESLVELLDPGVQFEPAPTYARPHRTYLGHSGLRQYLEDVAGSGST